MLTGVEVLPLALHLGIRLHLRIRFGVAIAVFDELRHQILEHQGVDAFVLVVRMHGHQQQVHTVILTPQPFQQPVPSEREVASLRFPERHAH